MATTRASPPITPRKRPVQARSRHTVQSILEATAQVLVHLGYASATTGAVAERAGVSIGSLYQYYPNKEALVAGLIELHVRQVIDMVASALQATRQASLAQMLRAVVRASLDAHRLNPALHKVLMEQVPRTGELAVAFGISQQLTDMLREDIAARHPRMSAHRVHTIAFVLETTIEALTHRAVVESPAWLLSGEVEAEAFKMLSTYLGAAPKGARPAIGMP